MNNKDIHIGIVGAGNIGSAIYQLLVSTDFNYKVSIADKIEKKWYIAEDDYVQLSEQPPVHFDMDESVKFNDFVNGKTLIINALPYTENINLYKACQSAGVAYFDLSEDDGLDIYLASFQQGMPFTMPHCGLAPGMSSIVAFHLLKQLDNPHKLKIRVGTLSQNASNKLRYNTSWSSEGLVNAYLGDCQVIRSGQNVTEKALTGYEKITIDGKEYEAFNTSGGIGTLAKTIKETWNNFITADYKTLRRIGHHDYVDFLFNDLQLDQSSLTDIFKTCIPKTRKDAVIIFVSASGDGEEDLYTYYKVFRPKTINGRHLSAVEYTTAIGLISMVELYINKKLPQEGYVKQEDVDWDDVLNTRFGNFYRE